MELIAGEGSQITKKQRFRSLKLVSLDLDEFLGQQPYGADYGRLHNGLSYYVRRNSKPRMRAALALAVKVGYATYISDFIIIFCLIQFSCNKTR